VADLGHFRLQQAELAGTYEIDVSSSLPPEERKIEAWKTTKSTWPSGKSCTRPPVSTSLDDVYGPEDFAESAAEWDLLPEAQKNKDTLSRRT